MSSLPESTFQQDAVPPRSAWALITDVTPGELGDAMTTAFLHKGVNVIATSPDAQPFEFIGPPTGTLDGFLVRLQLNVASAKSIANAVAQVAELTDGRLDFLFNNAEYGYCMPLMDVNISQARRQFDVNVWGLLAVTQAFFPMLSASKGTIINHSTVAGLQGYNRPYVGAYSSSKAAVHSLSATMRVELMPFDIKVVDMLAIGTKSEMIRKATGGLLPGTSAYLDIRSNAEAVMKGALLGSASDDVSAAAASMVGELLGGSSPASLARGYRIWITRLALSMLPQWILDWIAAGTGGLIPLRKPHGEVDKIE